VWFVSSGDAGFKRDCNLDAMALISVDELLVGQETNQSSLELQIPFKLYLGSQKDIEDARHLYKVVQDHLDTKMLNDFNQKFKTYELFNTYIT